jgi:hypothetical protein
VELLGAVFQFILGTLLMGVFSLTGASGRRHQALRNAGLNKSGARAGEWSPEAVAVVLAAYDPARVAPRRGELEPYQSVADAIFADAPVYEPLVGEQFSQLVSRLVSGVPDASPTARGLSTVTDRLLAMHDAAYRRLQE